MRWALIVCASCAGSSGWKPNVWNGPLDDPRARAIAAEFPDNQNGTELVLAVLAQAKASEVTAISELEIQVGGCVREVSMQPQASTSRQVLEPALDRIVMRAQETRYHCRKQVDQILTGGGVGGFDGPAIRFSDATIEIRDLCEHTPIERVVTRYRFEVEHGFVPPDWHEIERWTSAALTFGPPRCGGMLKNEIRAHFHSGSRRPPSGGLARGKPVSAIKIIELVKRAKAAAEANQPAQATHVAELALMEVGDGLTMDELDDGAALELADWVAGAYFYAVEVDADAFMRRELPVEMTATWASGVGADIDRIAKRYERIQDRVRLPAIATWLHAGAVRLAGLHQHAARLLEQGGQGGAAEVEREKARALAGRSGR